MSISSVHGFSKISSSKLPLAPSDLRVQFHQHLQNKYQISFDEELISVNLLAPFVIHLPSQILDQARAFISSTFAVRNSEEYLNFFAKKVKAAGIQDPGNKSILMSYDFHIDSQQNLKLIEINTNASFLALGAEMYEMNKVKSSENFELSEVCQNIENEYTLFGSKRPLQKIAIVDEAPSEQRLFAEFLIYQKLFERNGWQCQIEDLRQANPEDFDFIYNRSTDFYFREPHSNKMLQAFLQKKTCFSPNPFEYFLLADKERNSDWIREDFLNILNSGHRDVWKKDVEPHLLFMKILDASNAEEVWGMRKKLFFKPQTAFGSKQAFRGSSISRTAFDKIIETQSVAQEFCPAPEVETETPEGPQTFKFDLRCFAYQGRLQMILARMYQGQVTNLRTAYGGHACVRFHDSP